MNGENLLLAGHRSVPNPVAVAAAPHGNWPLLDPDGSSIMHRHPTSTIIHPSTFHVASIGSSETILFIHKRDLHCGKFTSKERFLH